MTEQEITVRECIRIILDAKTFPEVCTTWDYNMVNHAKNVIAEAIADNYNMRSALNELRRTSR